MGMLRVRTATTSFRASGYRSSHHELQLKPGLLQLKVLRYGIRQRDSAQSAYFAAEPSHERGACSARYVSLRPNIVWQVTETAPACHPVTSN